MQVAKANQGSQWKTKRNIQYIILKRLEEIKQYNILRDAPPPPPPHSTLKFCGQKEKSVKDKGAAV